MKQYLLDDKAVGLDLWRHPPEAAARQIGHDSRVLPQLSSGTRVQSVSRAGRRQVTSQIQPNSLVIRRCMTSRPSYAASISAAQAATTTTWWYYAVSVLEVLAVQSGQCGPRSFLYVGKKKRSRRRCEPRVRGEDLVAGQDGE